MCICLRLGPEHAAFCFLSGRGPALCSLSPLPSLFIALSPLLGAPGSSRGAGPRAGEPGSHTTAQTAGCRNVHHPGRAKIPGTAPREPGAGTGSPGSVGGWPWAGDCPLQLVVLPHRTKGASTGWCCSSPSRAVRGVCGGGRGPVTGPKPPVSSPGHGQQSPHAPARARLQGKPMAQQDPARCQRSWHKYSFSSTFLMSSTIAAPSPDSSWEKASLPASTAFRALSPPALSARAHGASP